MGQRRGPPQRSGLAKIAGALSAGAALVLAGCVSTVDGRAVSMLFDPFRVGGIAVTDGPSGPAENAPAPTGAVQDTDGGEIDRLALLSINDIEDYWQQNYPGFTGRFTPVDTLISYSSKNPAAPSICGVHTYQYVNAFYCYGQNLMAWDRAELFTAGRSLFGDMAITGILAHEYGHAVQDMAALIDSSTPTLVAEQQADCFAGAYLRWVVEGHSTRFSLNTTDGLDGLLAGLISLRDPAPGPAAHLVVDEGHGTALDRISALQLGFNADATTCTGIDTDHIEQRRGDMPMLLRREPTGGLETGEIEIDEDTLSTLIQVLDTSFGPARPPTLSFDGCAEADRRAAVSYCPTTNTIGVDLAELQQMVAAHQTANTTLPHGDNTALSLVMSRYMLALQHERGVELSSPMAGLRTACLTGVGQRKMFEPVILPDGTGLMLSAGDLDEAVTGLLLNGRVAAGVDGTTASAGFTRILAFRSGLLGDAELCYQRFP
jgi:predicted metalloprotease